MKSLFWAPLFFWITYPCFADFDLTSGNWGLNQIQAREGQGLVSPQRSVVVAVIDTGLDIEDPELSKCLWTNPGETGVDTLGRDRATNGVDDDRNGFVDDVHGWNFVQNTNDVQDRHGHGTHVAGIIAAVKQGERGCDSKSPSLRLMPLKYYDPVTSNFDNLINTIRAIRYATKMGVHIINYSGGGFFRNSEEEKAIREADEAGIVLVAAAGNESVNTDVIGFFPADYSLPNILSVTALEADGSFLRTSNFGVHSVKIAAPGREILSKAPRRRWQVMSGTSQSTAFATGVVALLMTQSKSRLAPQALIDRVILSGVVDSRLRGRTAWSTRLNAFRALAMKSEGVAVDGQSLGTGKSNSNAVETEILFDSTIALVPLNQWRKNWSVASVRLRAPAAVPKPQAASPLASTSGER